MMEIETWGQQELDQGRSGRIIHEREGGKLQEMGDKVLQFQINLQKATEIRTMFIREIWDPDIYDVY